MTAALEVRGLVRRFGNFTAVDEVSFQVRPGEVCGSSVSCINWLKGEWVLACVSVLKTPWF